MSAYSKTTLAWGMPVKADELGAHLEAYSKCRPVIHMLRLCHRFGKGEKAFIRRLPLELLNLVEEELFEESRLQHYVEWAKDFRCYESRCSKKDHFSVQELQRFRAERDKSHCKSEGACSDEVDMDTLLLDRKDKEDVHTARFRSWEYRVTPYAQFEIYNKLLRADFGLGISVSTHSVADYERTTIAYLLLPRNAKVEENIYCGELGFELTSSFLVSQAQCKPRSGKEKDRFRHAMVALHLTPFVHDTQLRRSAPTLAHSEVRENLEWTEQAAADHAHAKALKKNKWPKLILIHNFNFE